MISVHGHKLLPGLSFLDASFMMPRLSFVWFSDEVLTNLGNILEKTKVRKDDIGWDLEKLEAATHDAINHEVDSDDE